MLTDGHSMQLIHSHMNNTHIFEQFVRVFISEFIERNRKLCYLDMLISKYTDDIQMPQSSNNNNNQNELEGNKIHNNNKNCNTGYYQ